VRDVVLHLASDRVAQLQGPGHVSIGGLGPPGVIRVLAAAAPARGHRRCDGKLTCESVSGSGKCTHARCARGLTSCLTLTRRRLAPSQFMVGILPWLEQGLKQHSNEAKLGLHRVDVQGKN
jgi:hypothetical protein